MSLTWTPATDDDPEFTVTTATQHSVLAGRSTADAHPASAITTDNDWNGNLTSAGTNLAAVLDVIDNIDVSGGVDSVNGDTGAVVLDAADVDAVPITAVGLLAGERNRGDWSALTVYSAGDVVHDHADGSPWVCTVANTNEQPSLTPGKWTAIDGTGREFAVGAGSHAGTYGLSIGLAATSGGGGLSFGTAATSGGAGLSFGTAATSGAAGLSIGTAATSGTYGLSIGTAAVAGDYEVNVSGIYKGTVDSGDPTVPTGASIATGFVDLPETVDATNPAAGSQRLVARTDGLYVRDEAGTEVGPLGAGGGETLPATIIDAAGDLIIGTAADTAARLAVGTSGQVLTSNGTTAAWATPPTAPHIVAKETGEFYSLRGITTAASNHGLVLAAGSLHSIPVWLDAGNYDRIGVVTTVAAVSTWRLGVYPSDPTTGRPDGQAPLHDAGTLSTNATAGQLLITTSFTIPTRGVYWLACLVDAFTAAPTVHGWAASNSAFQPDALGVPTSNSSATVAQSRIARSATGVATGAMPATYPASAWANGGAVKIIVRSA